MSHKRCRNRSLLLMIVMIVSGGSFRACMGNALPGQIMIDPAHPDKLIYNRDANQDGRLDPAFLCGPGGPEGFLYGDISGGDTPDSVLDKIVRHGGNCIYIQGIRSHGGDGRAHHNPFVGHDPEKGLDSAILKKWERWFDRMEANGIVIYFFLFDDEVKIGPKETISPIERDYICGIVNAFEHHPNLVWVIAEEYSEIFSREKVSRIAAMIRKEDDHDHLIASHQLPNLAFDHADDPLIDQFAMQLRSTEGPCGDIHAKCLKALENANGRYNVNLAEQYDWHSDLLEAGDRDGVRRVNWATAITGTHIMHLGAWETGRKRCPPTVEMLEDYHRVHAFMESIGDLNLMRPQDHLVKSGIAWILGRKDHHIVYFPRGGNATIDLSGSSHRLNVTWYNPRNGEFIAKGTIQGGSVHSFTAPDIHDWVLVLNHTSRSSVSRELRRTPYPVEHYYYPLPGNSLTNHDRRAPQELGLDRDIVAGIRTFLRDHPYRRSGRKYSSRWTLWRHGYLVHVEGDFLRKQDVASLRKTWHALTVGAALKQGRIDSLNERISKYQTELTGNDALATWRHVMVQCAGFDYPVGPYPDFKPGRMWTYADYNPHHLCHALAKVYGQIGFFDHYDAVLDEAYFDAIGMTDWYSRNKVDRGTRMADGSPMWDGPRLVINMEHMGRLGLLVLARGFWNGMEIIPAWFVRELETKQTHGMLTNRRSPYGNPNVKRDPEAEKRESPYGFMTWVNTDGDLFPGADRHWARGSGAGGTIVMWNHTNGLVFVGAGIQPGSGSENLPVILERAIKSTNPLIRHPAVPRIGQFCHSYILVGHVEPYDKSTGDVQLNVTLAKPDGDDVKLKAIHYRDNLWKIPIAPDTLGVWNYHAEFSNCTSGTSGRFRCVPSEYSVKKP